MDKPVIAVDVDGVCADLLTEWLRRYNEQWDDNLKAEDITAWDLDKFVKPACGKEVYYILSEPGLYDSVSPFPEALDAVRWLRELGRVVFVTSCALNTMDAKFIWLLRHGFLPKGHSATKDFIACVDKHLIRADFLIDDGPHNLATFPGQGLLVDATHNRNDFVSDTPRINSLAEAPSLIASLEDAQFALNPGCGQEELAARVRRNESWMERLQESKLPK